MPKKCAFCPADAVEKGGEHVWDNWLNKTLPPSKYRAQKRYDHTSPYIEYDAASLNEKMPVVCEECNSGWMSGVSRKVKDTFQRPMLKGEPFSIGPREAALLAAFTMMKAAATDHLMEGEPFFTRAERERLRLSLVVPPIAKFWAAAFQGEYRISLKNNLRRVSTNERGILWGIEFCSFTYVVGHLVLQLLAPRWKSIEDSGKPLLSLTPNAYWNQATILFWPYLDGPFSWPPQKYLGDDAIKTFISRFNNPINVPLS